MRIPMSAVLLAAVCLFSPATAQEGKVKEASTKKVSVIALRKTGMSAFKQQDWQGAAKAFAQVTEQKPEDHDAWYRLGYSLHALGKLDSAMVAHKKAAVSPVSKTAIPATYNVACVHAMQGRTDDAFIWLAKARTAGFNATSTIANDPDMDNLRDDPRFKAFIKTLKASPATTAMTAYHNPSTRGAVRIAYFGGGKSGGQVHIDYGTPTWNEKHSKALKSEKFTDVRWRLGQNFWTNLDTCIPLTVGGKDVPIGLYYLTLEKKSDGRFLLAFNDPTGIRKQKLGAFVARYSRGGIEVEMKYGKVEDVADQLKIDLVKDAEDSTKAELLIHFGPHQFTTPVKIHVGK